MTAQSVVAVTSPSARVAQHSLAAMGSAMARLAEVLGVPASSLAAHEVSDRLEVSARLPVARLPVVVGAPLDGWFALFGDDLRLDFALDEMGGLDADVPLGAAPLRVTLCAGDNVAAALADFVRAVAEASAAGALPAEGSAGVRLALGKTRAVAAARALLDTLTSEDASAPEPAVLVYYQAAAWRRMLTLAALPLWTANGETWGGRPALVVLCDAAGMLEGVALTLWGACSPGDVMPSVPTRATWRRFERRAAQAYALRLEESAALDDLGSITAAHLRLVERAAGLEAMARVGVPAGRGRGGHAREHGHGDLLRGITPAVWWRAPRDVHLGYEVARGGRRSGGGCRRVGGARAARGLGVWRRERG